MATQAELESFRATWRAEVSSRAHDPSRSSSARQSTPQWPKPAGPVSHLRRVEVDDDDEDTYHHFEHGEFPQRPAVPVENSVESSTEPVGEPQSALEHYEQAVESETQGRLGESLALYREAFKMDHRVDQKYKSKHFPPSSFPPKPPAKASTAPEMRGPAPSFRELVASFAGLEIQEAPPVIAHTPAPPCPMAHLPDEILTHILRDVAVNDVADCVQAGLVCKRFAFLVWTQQQIWKRLCQGHEFGFAAMHYDWQTTVDGKPLEPDDHAPKPSPLNDEDLVHAVYASSWQRMFRLRPRIRFHGCYIATVNYIRPGQAESAAYTSASPVHIVTYYRYLRFYRDGTLISLLTTNQPIDVVHYLTKELVETHRNGAGTHLPSAVMTSALKGRWRMSSHADHGDVDLKDAERDIFVETEGVRPKYTYRMEFSMQNAGKSRRNNKLVWKCFYSYNKLTNDLAKMRNDRAYIYSRVKSYRVG